MFLSHRGDGPDDVAFVVIGKSGLGGLLVRHRIRPSIVDGVRIEPCVGFLGVGQCFPAPSANVVGYDRIPTYVATITDKRHVVLRG